MPEEVARFSNRELATARMLFPGGDTHLHDGTFVIAGPPDAAVRFATRVIARSLHKHRMRLLHVKVEVPVVVLSDSHKIRRSALALCDGASTVPVFVAAVRRCGDHLR